MYALLGLYGTSAEKDLIALLTTPFFTPVPHSVCKVPHGGDTAVQGNLHDRERVHIARGGACGGC